MKSMTAPIQPCACDKTQAQKLAPARGFEDEPVQRSTQAGGREFGAEQVHPGVLRPSSGGAPLPSAVQAKMEAAFGHDFANVRVHHGGGEAESIGAVAFTRGTHLHFAPGRYQPYSAEGQRLLGHELAHVIQQRARRVAHPGGAVPINADPALEREAERMGSRAAAAPAPAIAPELSQAWSEPAAPAPIQRSGSGTGSMTKHLGETEDEDAQPKAFVSSTPAPASSSASSSAACPVAKQGAIPSPAVGSSSALPASGPVEDTFVVEPTQEQVNLHQSKRNKIKAKPRRYQGLERLNRALRWVSSAAMSRDPKMQEMQATVHSGQLVMSSNERSHNLLGSLSTALREGPVKHPKPNPRDERQARHLRNIGKHLLDEKGFAKYRERMLGEIADEGTALPEGVGRQDALRQADAILHTIQGGVRDLHAGEGDVRRLRVVQNRSASGTVMHAEQALYEDIASNEEAVVAATRKAYGMEAESSTQERKEGPDTPVSSRLILPVAGERRPCATCHSVEQGARSRGLFDQRHAFTLLRASRSPGTLFGGKQRIAQNVMGDGPSSIRDEIRKGTLLQGEGWVTNAATPSVDSDSESDEEQE